jgi:hypothetical protein
LRLGTKILADRSTDQHYSFYILQSEDEVGACPTKAANQNVTKSRCHQVVEVTL